MRLLTILPPPKKAWNSNLKSTTKLTTYETAIAAFFKACRVDVRVYVQDIDRIPFHVGSGTPYTVAQYRELKHWDSN